MHRQGQYANQSDASSIAGPSNSQRSFDATNQRMNDSNEPRNNDLPTLDEGHEGEPQDTGDADTSLGTATSSRKKSKPVRSACNQCQRRKTKCSGERPTCQFCYDRGLTCSWQIGFGMTRAEDLRQRLVVADTHTEDIKTLVHDMRNNTDHIATTLLAKLRLGASIQDLAAGIRAGTTSSDDTIGPQANNPDPGR